MPQSYEEIAKDLTMAAMATISIPVAKRDDLSTLDLQASIDRVGQFYRGVLKYVNQGKAD